MEVVYINTTAGNSYAVINQMDEMIPMQLMKMASEPITKPSIKDTHINCTQKVKKPIWWKGMIILS